VKVDLEKDIVELRGQIAAKSADEVRARTAADEVVAELRSAGVNPLTDKDAFEKVDAAYKVADGLKDEVAELRTRAERALSIVGRTATDSPSRTEAKEAQDLAARLMASPQYAALRASGVLGQDSGSRISMLPASVATRDELLEGLRLRATVDNASGSGGGLIWSDRKGIVVPMAERRVRLLDVITVGETDSDTVEYVRETTRTHAAAETAYGTAAPESSYGWTKDSTTVKRIPHFVPATKGALADAGQLRTLLQASLLKGLRLRIEGQVLNGNGTGENLSGILDGDRSPETIALGTDTRFDAVHKAVTTIRVACEDTADPSAIGLHPNDYERIVLEKDSAGNYVNGRGATELGTIWGLTPVVSTLFTEGTPLVGDYSQAILWVRQGLTLEASDSHSDYFTKGLVALMATTRAAFDVLIESAFCTVTGFDA
jgi:HK97 family phage major capsid protein